MNVPPAGHSDKKITFDQLKFATYANKYWGDFFNCDQHLREHSEELFQFIAEFIFLGAFAPLKVYMHGCVWCQFHGGEERAAR